MKLICTSLTVIQLICYLFTCRFYNKVLFPVIVNCAFLIVWIKNESAVFFILTFFHCTKCYTQTMQI